ncbi:MAG: peroxidase-related enzyme [Acidobacteriaceae bacterium]
MDTMHRSPASTNLPVVEEGQADAEVSLLYDQFRSRFGRQDLPGILKCFATHPPLLRNMMDIAEAVLFAEGHLTRRHKEMIAAFVSEQNHCPYCADSHGYRLRLQGGSAEALCALQENDLRSPALTTVEQSLLRFVEKINRSSHEIARADVDLLIENGWRGPQIAEAVHVAALYAAFNRIANGFGLRSQGLLAFFERST